MIEGSCHCGAARWRLDRVPETATACNCTVCRRWGALWAYGWRDEEIHLSGPTQTYRRAAGAVVRPYELDFHFCATCACIVAWQTPEPGPDGRRWIAVNLRLAEPQDVAEIPLEHFDGLGGRRDLGQDGRRVKDVWF